MSTDVNAPSSPRLSFRPHSRSGLFRKPTSQHQPPPAAFETQATRRPEHGRSASFGGIVSRMLPSRRQEKGHSLRSAFQDDGRHNAVDLVFGLADPPNVAVSETMNSGRTSKVKSASPRKDGDRRAEAENDNIYRSHKFAVRDDVGGEVRKSRPRSMSFNWLLGTKGAAEKSSSEKSKQVPKEQEMGGIPHPRSSSRPPALPLQLQKTSPFKESKTIVQEVDTSKAKQIFELKKTRREQRRSLRESGDFLGVQGANPRTGMWDLSDNTTSSSEPSQVGIETRRKLEQEAKDVKSAKLKYEDAQAKHWAELQRLQDLKGEKKKEKAERRTLEGKTNQTRRSKWKVSDNGWSSVAEPTLSPIEQSLTGSPVREVPPPDRLLPMPCAANVTNDSFDYFGLQTTSSPLARFHTTAEASSTPVKPSYAIRRKPVGSPPSRGQRNGSMETILRGSSNPTEVDELRPKNKVPGEFPSSLSNIETPPRKPYPFLGSEDLPTIKPSSPYERLATAISYRSVTTSQVKIHEPRSRQASYQGKIISFPSELPPIFLKDPISARIPLSFQPSQPLRTQAQVCAPPTIMDNVPVSSTNTSTTTTTGSTPQRHLLAQLDGTDDYDSNIQLKISAKHPILRHKSSRIPLRSSSLPNNKQNNMLRKVSPIRAVDNATFSEHHLDQMKHRTARLCQTGFPEVGKAMQRSIPTSIFTSPRSPSRRTVFAHNAALQAFQNLKEQTARETSRRYSAGALTPPRVQMRRNNARRDVNLILDHEENQSGSPKTCKIGRNNELQDRGKHLVIARTGELLDIRAERAAIWRAEMNMEKHKMVGKNARTVTNANGVALSKDDPRCHLTIGIVVRNVLHTAWWIVGPVFDPESDLQRRWAHHRLTWKDMGVFIAAGVFAVAILLITVACARALGVGFQVVKALVGLFKWLTG